MVGADSPVVAARCASSGVHDSGEDPMPRRADRDVGEALDHPCRSFSALPQRPARVAAYARPQRARSRRLRPPSQRRPSLRPAQLARRPRTRLRAHLVIAQQLARPQPQREHDRGRGVATVRELALRAHHHDRFAVRASVASLREHADGRPRCQLRISRAPALPRTKTVALHDYLPRRGDRRHAAQRAARGPRLLHARRRSLPRLDVEIEVDDMTLALGVVLQSTAPPGLGRAVQLTPTRPSSLVGGPGSRPATAPPRLPPKNTLVDAVGPRHRADRIRLRARRGAPRRDQARPLTLQAVEGPAVFDQPDVHADGPRRTMM